MNFWDHVKTKSTYPYSYKKTVKYLCPYMLGLQLRPTCESGKIPCTLCWAVARKKWEMENDGK
jgi:hypothetical protein